MNTKHLEDTIRFNKKSKRRTSIITSAEKVFCRQGFEKTTMQEIADEDQTGVATLFRYFPKKDKLIVAVAVTILERYITIFQKYANMEGTCLDKIDGLFDFFISQNKPENIVNAQLIEAFESYASLLTEPLDDIAAYNQAQKNISNIFSTIVEEGKTDGSIRSDIPVWETLSSITNAFGIFSRKLSLFENIPLLEADLSPENQLTILKQIFIEHIRAK